MARASFISDLKIIVNSVMRHWDNTKMESLLAVAFKMEDRETIFMTPEVEFVMNRARKLPGLDRPISAEQSAGAA
jgi:hypothetical protein